MNIIKKTKLPTPVILFLISLLLPTTLSLSVGSFRLTGTRILLIFLIIPLTLRLFSKKEGPVTIPDKFIFMYCIWMVLAFFVNHDFSTGIESGGVIFLEAWGSYLIARIYIKNVETFINLIKFFLICLLFLLTITIPETLTGFNYVFSLTGHVSDAGIDKRFGFNRSYGIFDHPIIYGVYCSSLLGMIWFTASDKASDLNKYRATFIVVLAGTVSFSSGAIMALSIQFIIIMWYKMTYPSINRWKIFIGLIVLTYLFVDLLSNRSGLKVFLSYLTFSPHTAYWRTIIWEHGMQNVYNNPWFGLGFHDWVRPAWMYSGSMDNFWLVNMVRYGFPTFFFLFLAILSNILNLSNMNNKSFSFIRMGYIVSLIGICFTAATVHFWNQAYNFFMFIVGLGTALVVQELVYKKNLISFQ